MPLTELQMPSTKEPLYDDLRNLAGQIVSFMIRLEEAAQFLALIDSTDIDTL